MDKCLDSLGEEGIFSTLDANYGYWQIEVHDRDNDKTTFTSLHALYRSFLMLLRLKNAPSTFQREMDIGLSPGKWKFLLIYLDDVIIFSTSVEEHLDHLLPVLGLLSRASVS